MNIQKILSVGDNIFVCYLSYILAYDNKLNLINQKYLQNEGKDFCSNERYIGYFSENKIFILDLNLNLITNFRVSNNTIFNLFGNNVIVSDKRRLFKSNIDVLNFSESRLTDRIEDIQSSDYILAIKSKNKISLYNLSFDNIINYEFVTDFIFSLRGTLLSISNEIGTKIYDLMDNKQLIEIKGLYRVKFHPSKNIIYYIPSNKRIESYDTLTGNKLKVYNLINGCLDFTVSEEKIFIVTLTRDIQIINL